MDNQLYSKDNYSPPVLIITKTDTSISLLLMRQNYNGSLKGSLEGSLAPSILTVSECKVECKK